jgi:hypothetical protein
MDVDMKMENPCHRPKISNVKAEQILYQDKKYYYMKAPDGTVSIYEYKEKLDAYIELDRSHPHYEALIEKLS